MIEGLQVEAKQSALIANNAMPILDYTRRRVASRSEEVINPICSVLVRLHLHILSCLESPSSRGMLKNLEASTEMVRGLEHIGYEKKL